METKKRIQWIDAMRGFTMFLVVLGHVFLFSLGYAKATALPSIFLTFRMPLFFFISGFVAYKSVDKWNSGFFIDNLLKKTKVQLIPTIFFFVLYCAIVFRNPITHFLEHGFGRFWFTFVLLEMFVVYFSSMKLANHFKINEFSILFPIAILCVLFTLYPYDNYQFCRALDIRNLITYLPYFIFGSFCRKHQERFIQLLLNDRIRTVLFLLFVYLLIHIHNYFDFLLLFSKVANVYIVRWVGLLFVLSFFVSKRDYFAADGTLSRVMQYIGRHTLEIYMIHNFFLPKLPFMNQFFCGNQNTVLELLFASFIAACIIGLSLLCGIIIRNSSFLAHYLFAEKIR